ncbi:MAG: PBP1A family penicillin-binding protein [Acidobacteriota bacterium]
MTRRRSKTPSTSRKRLRQAFMLLCVLGLGATAWVVWPFWQLSGQFGSQPTRQPSRLYGTPEVLEPERPLAIKTLVELLDDMGYVAVEPDRFDRRTTVPGSYAVSERQMAIHRRPFPSPRGRVGGDRLLVTFRGGRIASITRDGESLAGVWLDPPLIASYYGDALQERRPMALDELPRHLMLSVLAAEDAGFMEHAGLSVRGILRAAWANVRASAVRQGGSTLTQQLVKNLYLSHERRWSRKAREAVLAVMLEWRYEKTEILQAYVNEIYWGRSGNLDLMGIGAAAHAYFGKHPMQLSLGESAILAGMIQSPATLSPVDHPDAAKARRDVILGRLAQLDWLPLNELEAASREPIRAVEQPLIARRAPYFADYVAGEAKRRFGIEELDDAGLVLHSTLAVRDQAMAEESVSWGVQALEEGWEKGQRNAKPLQVALVSLDPRDAAIRAYVGGRDYRGSQFDRVSTARRQAGSAFKPIVYAAAFEQRIANPATFLEDSPYTVRLAGKTWSPQNSDGQYHGWVSARTALEKSYNVPTARLAAEMGLDAVADMAKRLGIGRDLRALPALALGAMEVTPLELATVYSTLAAGGVRSQPHGLVAVFDRQGQAVAPNEALPAPRRVLPADVSYLLTRVLQGVLDRGTATRARRVDRFDDPVAGKTGTTNDRRDSWFAGYSPDRATLVWVGYDDNARTRLSGARAALPIWTRFAAKVRPPGGTSEFPVPEGVVQAWIDPRTGGLAHDQCGERQLEVFLESFVPSPYCADDGSFRFRHRGEPSDPVSWWRRLIGRDTI